MSFRRKNSVKLYITELGLITWVVAKQTLKYKTLDTDAIVVCIAIA